MAYPDPIPAQPATPLNERNNQLNSPRAPMRHRTDVPRHPSTPLPPSASNFLDQNNFPSLQSPHFVNDQHPHTLPSSYHYPQPQFVQPPHSQFYSSRQRPYEHQYFLQPQYFPQHQPHYFYPPPIFPSHNINNVPLPTSVPLPLPSHNINNVPLPMIHLPTPPVTVSPTVPKPLPLPSVAHIPILSGRSDFSAWSNGARSLILYLGLAGHIADQPAPGIAPHQDRIPSYPPAISSASSIAELAISRTWWEEDNVVSHVLTS